MLEIGMVDEWIMELRLLRLGLGIEWHRLHSFYNGIFPQ